MSVEWNTTQDLNDELTHAIAALFTLRCIAAIRLRTGEPSKDACECYAMRVFLLPSSGRYRECDFAPAAMRLVRKRAGISRLLRRALRKTA